MLQSTFIHDSNTSYYYNNRSFSVIGRAVFPRNSGFSGYFRIKLDHTHKKEKLNPYLYGLHLNVYIGFCFSLRCWLYCIEVKTLISLNSILLYVKHISMQTLTSTNLAFAS